MIRFLCRRLVFAMVLIIGASSAALLLTRAAPGDLTATLGPFATQAELDAARARYGLDRHPIDHLTAWAVRAVRLDFGESFLYNEPVASLVGRAALNTAVLAVAALGVATALGIGLGIVAGSGRGVLAGAIRALSVAAISMPPLLMVLLLLFVAARTGWLPTGSMTSPGAAELGWAAWAVDVAWHMPVPVLALALPMAATFERLQSQALAESLAEPFVTAAAAKGLSRRDVVLRHAWPVSLRPICGIYGIAIGALLSGSFVVEYVTAWPGLGRMMAEALKARDVYLVSGCAAAAAALLAAGTFVGDVLLAAVDPRVRQR